jgi:peptidoglycan/LPS O-acetylase OafA/YrhL
MGVAAGCYGPSGRSLDGATVDAHLARSEAVDAIRGMAIALVVASHCWPEIAQNGALGVDLFFVLSGYLIGGILLDNRGASGFFTTFYGRRAFRILPLYWLLLAATGCYWRYIPPLACRSGGSLRSTRTLDG